MNGSQIYRASYKITVDGTLYAMVGAGGDATTYGFSTSPQTWLGAMNRGGHGGGVNGGNGFTVLNGHSSTRWTS